MGKYLKFVGGPQARFEDNDGTTWENDEIKEAASAERAKELVEQFPGMFEESTQEEAKKTEATGTEVVVSETVVKPEGEVRYVDPETGNESLTPITRPAGEVE